MNLIRFSKLLYHEHYAGYETFFVLKGKIEVTLAGISKVVDEGGLVHVPPYMRHSMVFPEDTTFLAYFYNYKFYNVMQERNILKENNPEILEDVEFKKEFGKRHDSHNVLTPDEILAETRK